ncbi:hypothetical protein [Georgenia sp. AZ-5]|uniref:hypothetical protein n=1 Tax=Georgenia sp. AZ-5 TaxID=3367526 RepID=UPI0037552B09
MTWTKLSDDFTDDCWTLSDAAFRMHAEALVWSNRKLLDLRIPKDDFVRAVRHPDDVDALDELLRDGLWRDDGDVYVILHQSQYQRTREAVIAQHEANVENGKKGGRPPKPRREQVADLREATKTQSLSKSLGESPTERDRTGQAAVKGSQDETVDESVPEKPWLPKTEAGQSVPKPQRQPEPEASLGGISEDEFRSPRLALCELCGEPLSPGLAVNGYTAHPNCTAVAAR